jgi:alkaline phosphatase D
MLGEEQWRWLSQELRKPAQVRLVVSSIQVIPEDHKWEKWANLPLEQERLFRTIREAGASGVVFLSGDRHLAEFSVRDGGAGYPLYDFTSSSLNASRTDWRAYEPNRWRISTVNVGHNFGMIMIDWRRPDPLLRLQVRGESGETLVQQVIPLSWLQPGKIKGSSS